MLSIRNKGSQFLLIFVIANRPPHSWSLHPPTVTPPPQNTVPEPERKKPKGVQLQFDINSVGKQVLYLQGSRKNLTLKPNVTFLSSKQTAMTLNERFRILKQKRIVAAQQNARGGRFVTVG